MNKRPRITENQAIIAIVLVTILWFVLLIVGL